MPFYPSERPANKQKEAEEIAPLYGLQPPAKKEKGTMTQNQTVMTDDQAEQMRELLLQHDKNKSVVNNFDLSKPVIVPYVFRKFPMTVYDHENSRPARDELVKTVNGETVQHVPAHYASRIVNNEKELKKALESGFQEKPPTLGYIGVDGEQVQGE